MLERVDRGRRRPRVPSAQLGRYSSGHAATFSATAAAHFDTFSDGGGYPHGFLPWAYELLGVGEESAGTVLHVCSGSLRAGITVDVRMACRPTVVADGRALPFRNETFDHVLIDPPYGEDYARTLYDTEKVYPAPAHLVREASRVLRPGGRLGFLHFLVPPFDGDAWRWLRTHGVVLGPGYAIRAFTVLERTHSPARVTPAARSVNRAKSCLLCGAELERETLRAGGAFRPGRPARYCSSRCRQAAFRARRA